MLGGAGRGKAAGRPLAREPFCSAVALGAGPPEGTTGTWPRWVRPQSLGEGSWGFLLRHTAHSRGRQAALAGALPRTLDCLSTTERSVKEQINSLTGPRHSSHTERTRRPRFLWGLLEPVPESGQVWGSMGAPKRHAHILMQSLQVSFLGKGRRKQLRILETPLESVGPKSNKRPMGSEGRDTHMGGP